MLDVLTLDGGRIAAVIGFITADIFVRDGVETHRFSASESFPRFGLPVELPA